MKYKTLEFNNCSLKLIDQRKLPQVKEYFFADNYREIEYAIKNMVVRGAPAIGATAAYGVYLAALEYRNLPAKKFIKKILQANNVMAAARPTAVNLTWALNRMENVLKENKDCITDEMLKLLLNEAKKIEKEDIEINKKIGDNGNSVIPVRANILTHCNAGALATVSYGTALGIIRAAYNSGKKISVYADETRPRLQGARLTAFELMEEGIDVILIVDSVAPTLIKRGKIDLIVVGADRIALNGDTANKIGTYMLSEIASKFSVPFYIAAPVSTIDFNIDSGKEIEIEERNETEVTHIVGNRIAPEGIKVYNPAFDITPAENITGIITEKEIINPPFKENIIQLFK